MSARTARMSDIALAVGSVGLAVDWLGSRLYLDWSGVFTVGLLLVLSTGVLIFGIVGLHTSRRFPPDQRALSLAGVVLTSLGLISRATIAAAGIALLTVAAYRSKSLPGAAFAVVLAGTLVLAFEELRYGALVAIRNDDPLAAGTPLTSVRWLVASGLALQTAGWTWLSAALWRRRTAATAEAT